MNADGLRDVAEVLMAHDRYHWATCRCGLKYDKEEHVLTTHVAHVVRVLADAGLLADQRHIDAAREQDLAAIEAQIAEHVATRVTSLKELVDTLVALDDKHTADRDAAVARAEAAEAAIERVRALAFTEAAAVAEGPSGDVLHDVATALDIANRIRALDGTP